MATQFSGEEKAALLALKGVGPTIVTRLEQMGFSTLQRLAQADVQEILEQGAEITGSTCWKNSPQAKKAIGAAMGLAKERYPNDNEK